MPQDSLLIEEERVKRVELMRKAREKADKEVEEMRKAKEKTKKEVEEQVKSSELSSKTQEKSDKVSNPIFQDPSYIQVVEAIKAREVREKAEKEAKLLLIPTQKLLPDIFKDKRAVPNCFLRSALFGIVRKGKRALVKEQEIVTMSQYNITFSGEQLDQNDLEVWDTLIYLAKQYNVQDELRVTIYELLKTLRISDNGTNRKAVIARIKRLAFGQVAIKIDKKEYFGSLIDDGYVDNNADGKLVVRYNKKLATLFIDKDFTLINVNVRNTLKDNQLARWLYNFYESHTEPLPFKVEMLQQLCHSESDIYKFKYMLKEALELVKAAHFYLNLKIKWNYKITDADYVLVYK